MGSRHSENKFSLIIRKAAGNKRDTIARDNLVDAAALIVATEALNGSTWNANLQTAMLAVSTAMTAAVAEFDTPT